MNSINFIDSCASYSVYEERKFVHRWAIQNFCCETTNHEEILPTSQIKFTLDKSLHIKATLKLGGSTCDTRYCLLELDYDYPIKVFAKLWVGGQSETTKHCWDTDTLSHDIKKTLWDTKTKECLLAKDNIITFEAAYDICIRAKIPHYIEAKEFKLKNNFAELFETKRYSDVALSVADKSLPAHKLILSARSKVFAAMFEHKMKESESNVVNISNIRFDVLEEMLRYIYTDEAPNINQMAEELLAASDQYDLQNLKSMCEIEMIMKLSNNDVADILVFANLYNLKTLKDHAITYIKNNIHAVAATEGWKNLFNNDCHHLLMEILDNHQV